MKVAVVTPTIGSQHLEQCLRSVREQTYQNLTHYIFADGRECYGEVDRILSKEPSNKNIETVFMSDNIGKGWYGHRVYAACSFLVNADIICYLDEDNWFEPCHIEKLVSKIEEGNDWSYSLRKIYDKDGDFVCEDNCESLGKWPAYVNENAYLVDTSSFAIKREVALQVGHTWYAQWGADRQFLHFLKEYFPKFDCSNSYTLCYRLDGNPNSVNRQFFEEGNKIYSVKYKDEFPWRKTNLLSIGPGISLVG